MHKYEQIKRQLNCKQHNKIASFRYQLIRKQAFQRLLL